MIRTDPRADRLAQLLVPRLTPYNAAEPLSVKQQAGLLLSHVPDVLFGGAAGGGKALRCPDRADPSYNVSMETRVLTPKGFKLIGDIQLGDQVCNPDGTVARVVAVHDRSPRPFYKVTLADGSSVEAAHDHLWAYSVAGHRRRRKQDVPIVPPGLRPEDEWNLRVAQRCTVGTTDQLAALVTRANADGSAGDRARYVQLPLTAPVNLTGPRGRWDRMPPYALGVLVGDGSIGGPAVNFASADPEIAERVSAEIAELGLRLTAQKPRSGCTVYCVAGRVGVSEGSPQQLLRRDRLMGCRSWEKFIPDRIKFAAVPVRRAFMQGLMDSDGHMDNRGHVEFVTVSERLARDAQWVLRSLGCRATLTTKQPHFTHKGERRAGRLAYRLYIQGPHLDRLFGLERKAARVRPFNGGDVWPSHRVVSVEPSGVDRARCITVDHPNGLYVTDDFIVTHNSSWLLHAALQYVDVPGYSAILFRRTYKQLAEPGALMDRSKLWLGGTDAEWSEGDKKWVFPSGATLSFGHLDTANDWMKYQGPEYQFCVDLDTPILMADGSWVPIKAIRVGDMVMTLEGPRRVYMTHRLGRKPCTEVTTELGTTVVSDAHRLLTAFGWASPRALRSIQCRVDGSIGGYARAWSPSVARPDEYPLADRWLLRELGRQIPPNTDHPATCAWSADHRSGSVMSGDGRREHQRPPRWFVQLVLHGPALDSAASSSAPCDARADDCYECVVQGCRDDCRDESRSDDAQLRRRQAVDQAHTPSPSDVEEHHPTRLLSDDRYSALAHTQPFRGRLVHPYTSVAMDVKEDVRTTWARMVQAGEREVADLSVDRAAHYIAWPGIISANCGLDELTQFDQVNVRYLWSRLRKPKPIREWDPGALRALPAGRAADIDALAAVPLRFRATSNPGGPAHDEVKSRYGLYRPDGDPDPRRLCERSEWVRENERVFIPSKVRDNPGLDVDEYVKSLDHLDPTTREQLLNGDWDVVEPGEYFRREWFPIRDTPPAIGQAVRYWDFAATEPSDRNPDPDWTVGLKLARKEGGGWVVLDVQRFRRRSGDIERRVRAVADADGMAVRIGMEQEPGASGKAIIRHYRVNVLSSFSAQGFPPADSKQIRARPVASKAEAGLIDVIRAPWNQVFFDELERFPPEKDSGHDDQVDALTGAFIMLEGRGVWRAL